MDYLKSFIPAFPGLDPQKPPRAARKRKAPKGSRRAAKKVNGDGVDTDQSVEEWEEGTQWDSDDYRNAEFHPQQSKGSFAPDPDIPSVPIRNYTRPTPRQASQRSASLASTPSERAPAPVSAWSKSPNAKARKILEAAKSPRHAQVKIFNDASLNEPWYTKTDVEIRDSLWQIMDKLEVIAKTYFGNATIPTETVKKHLLDMDEETVTLIGCVASGGPQGDAGWYSLFQEDQKRRALVCAIIGKVLVEQVFAHQYFGGDAENIHQVLKIETNNRTRDGFERKQKSATYLQTTRQSPDTPSFSLPPRFAAYTNRIIDTLHTHLLPIYTMLHPPSKPSTRLLPSLSSLATHASILSLLMRSDPHTVYYFSPVFKEDIFSRKYMECFNRRQMELTHPRERKWPASTSEQEKRRAQMDEPLTQICMFDGVTAYRVGGWETGGSGRGRGEVVYEDVGGEGEGIRSRVLSHGWVYCRWGRARRFVGGRPADEAVVHGEGWKGGFREFREVVGGLRGRGRV